MKKDALPNTREEFEAFKTQKHPVDYDDIYTRLALFPYIKDWATAKTGFFVGFSESEERKHCLNDIFARVIINSRF